MELIYIIGKRNGTPRSAFTEAEVELRKMGFVAVNPLEEILRFNEFDQEGLCSPEEERDFLHPLFERCEGVYTMPGWNSCDTAKAEYDEAIIQEKHIMFQPQKVLIEDIIRAAEEVTGMRMEEIRARTRKGGVVEVRRAIFYLACKYRSSTLVALGQMFGLDHTSVIHSRNTAQALLDSGDERASYIINQIKDRLIA